MKEKSISIEIKYLDNLIMRNIFKDTRMISNINMTPIQIGIMHYLFKNNNKAYQKDIEIFFGFRRSTISGVLKTMEKNKIIIRKDSLIDGRQKEIFLTKESILRAKEFQKKNKVFDEIIKKNISANDLNIFFNVVDQIKNNLINREE